MNMKKKLASLASAVAVATMMFSSVSVYAAQQPQLPQSVVIDGREFIMDVTAGGGSGTATPDSSMNTLRGARAAYTLLGSDVRLYIDPSHGHGGDHVAVGWVQATAPSFTARAEIWRNGQLDTTGPNCLNVGNTANASSYLTVGVSSSNVPRIFYAW